MMSFRIKIKMIKVHIPAIENVVGVVLVIVVIEEIVSGIIV